MADVVLAAAHDVGSIVLVLAAAIMVDGPHTVIPVYPYVSCDDVRVLDDRCARPAIFIDGCVVHAVHRQIRLSVP